MLKTVVCALTKKDVKIWWRKDKK